MIQTLKDWKGKNEKEKKVVRKEEGRKRRKTQGRKREDETEVEIWRRNKSDCKNYCQVFEL